MPDRRSEAVTLLESKSPNLHIEFAIARIAQ
jgi:hypothetical protein